MIPPAVRAEILRRIRAAEEHHGVRVLLEVESGSRAWGFESPNSDFDARFIYAHPPAWYLSIGLEEQRDVIEYPIVDDIDLNGWDIRKALRLFWRSNPAFVEWIQSPIVYAERGSFAAGVRRLIPSVYSCEKGMHHYRRMATKDFRGHLMGPMVPLKKYFYVLRPLLAARWLARYEHAAPIEFHKLLHLIEDDKRLVADIEALLVRKRTALEMDLAPAVPSIHEFIELELDRLEAINPPAPERAGALATLDDLFQLCIAEAWDGPSAGDAP